MEHGTLPPSYPDVESQKDHKGTLDVNQRDANDTQIGVKKVIAAQYVWSLRAKVCLFFAIALASFMIALDQGTNYNVYSTAFNALHKSTAANAVQAATSMLLAVGKPFFGKYLNVVGRPETLVTTICFICFGYLVASATPRYEGLSAGLCFWQIGFSGFQMAIQVIIADVTNLRLRGFWSAMASSFWQFLTFYANGQIVQTATGENGLGWRWFYGLEAICYIPAVVPVIIIIYWAQYRAKKDGVINYDEHPLNTKTWYQRVLIFLDEVDAVGIYLLLSTLIYILLPIILANQAFTWQDAAVPAMMCVGGFIILPAFCYWEMRCAKHPILPYQFLANRNILITCMINLFDFICFYLSFGVLYNFSYAATDWDSADITYYTNTQNLSLCFFGIAWGVIAGIFQIKWKWSVTGALCVRMLGVGIMFYARDNLDTGSLVMTQVLQGAGGGIAATATQLGAQGSVAHQNLALATAAILLFAEIGNVIGSAASSAINVAFLPQKISEMFPEYTTEQVNEFVQSVGLVRGLGSKGTADRDRMIQAYSNSQRMSLIPAIVIAAVPIVLSFFLKDFKIDKRRNIVENVNEDGTEVLQFKQNENENRRASGSVTEEEHDNKAPTHEKRTQQSSAPALELHD